MRLVPWNPHLFRDRAAAGRALSVAVAGLELDEPVVIGVARGGVAVAVEVARELVAPLTAIDVERVNASGLRLGAVTADGPPYLRNGHGVAGRGRRVRDRARSSHRRGARGKARARGVACCRADDGRGRRPADHRADARGRLSFVGHGRREWRD